MNKQVARKVLPLCAAAVSTTGLLFLVGCGGGGGDDDTVTQIDRMGFPAVNTALISSANKDAFNQGDPRTDRAAFCAEMLANLQGLRDAVNNVPGFPPQDGKVPGQAVIDVVCPDVITVDLSASVAFPNGRQLGDDVIDPILGLVLDRGDVLGGGPGVSDGVGDDNAFRTTFPYLGVPNP